MRPEYDLLSLPWMVRRAEKVNRRGELRKVALRDASGAIAGWYLYYLNSGGPSEVLQMCARGLGRDGARPSLPSCLE